MTLAIGGKPASDEFIAYGRQSIDPDDIQAVVDILQSDYLTTGPMVDAFEKKLAKFVGAKYAVAYSNGTAALHAACFAAGIGEGDEVITTPLTFAASANCTLYMGGTPVFADIDPNTYNIDPEDIERKITEKTKAIIPVHFTGQSVELDKIRDIANRYNLVVIEDAAHALGTMYKGKKIGSISEMTEFSFHPVKTITTGEGGAITTNSLELYRKLKLFVTHGITRDKDILIDKEQGGWYYEQHALGFNYRITDIQCALGVSQLNRVGDLIARRKQIVETYNKAFQNIDGVIVQSEIEDSDTARHLYIIQLELEKLKASRNEIFDALRAENIGVNVHYVPVYFHPYYQNLGYKKGLCPKAEALYERIITVPLHPSMSDDNVKAVIEAVQKVIEYFKK